MRRRLLLLAALLSAVLLVIGGSVWASPSGQDAAFTAFVLDTRADLDLLASVVFTEDTYPDNYTFNADPRSASFVADLWFDNELLADALFGAGLRPEDWFGATGINSPILARNVRHDLELSADAYSVSIGSPPSNRPEGWRGASPVYRCDRSLQNILELLRRFFNIAAETPESVVNYCAAVEAELEDDLLRAAFASETAAPDIPALTLAVRGDLERLADERLGLNNRPAGWIGNRDVASPSLASDLFLDLETLANALLGEAQRPEGWIEGVAADAATAYLSLRYDLELLADATLGSNQRPNGWQGTEPLRRCSPLTQSLVSLVRQAYPSANLDADPNSGDFCAEIDAEANLIAENPPVPDVVAGEEIDQRLFGESNFAFAYLDPAATQYMGIMPGGTRFRAWYRNFSDSTMMFVSGDNFALYVSYEFTSLPTTVFDSLPTLEGREPLTFCDAEWCNGPGPTPTPTGAGALGQIVAELTPGAGGTPLPGTTGTPAAAAGKSQVSWNNIRVTYISDDTAARTAQVALEICSQPAQVATACEPVTTVTNRTTNQPITPASQYNGLNVYIIEYGYSPDLLIEGENLYSNDVWISDPTIR